MRQHTFTKFVQIGRVISIADGDFDVKLGVILDIINHSRVLVDFPLCKSRRADVPIRDITLTSIVLPIHRMARSRDVTKAFNDKKVVEAFNTSALGKKIIARKVKSELSDFDRYKIRVAKKQKNRLIASQSARIKRSLKVKKLKAAGKKEVVSKKEAARRLAKQQKAEALKKKTAKAAEPEKKAEKKVEKKKSDKPESTTTTTTTAAAPAPAKKAEEPKKAATPAPAAAATTTSAPAPVAEKKAAPAKKASETAAPAAAAPAKKEESKKAAAPAAGSEKKAKASK